MENYHINEMSLQKKELNAKLRSDFTKESMDIFKLLWRGCFLSKSSQKWLFFGTPNGLLDLERLIL